LLLLGAVLASAGLPDPPAGKPARPRLAVLIVFDQLRGDYLLRWQDLFDKGGFRRLAEEGVWFQNCHYPHALTVTAAGHASIATGATPDRHGVIGNEWYDRKLKSNVTSVASERHTRIPPLPEKANPLKPALGASPERLLAPTLSDSLKEATGGKGKVVCLSFKDRSAILPGGKKPDACYWLDSKTGEFVTSTYYGGELHAWVAEFNKQKPADQWQGKDWSRMRPDLDYEKYSGPDDVVGEGSGAQQGRTFPHPMGPSPDADDLSSYYSALYNSPFGNDLLLALAKRAVAAEELGKDEIPDLLCLSFSSNDAVGHTWGPDSQEVLDITLRSDRLVEELLAYLDEKVGKGRYVVALSSDHGVCPLPEVSRAKGKAAERLSASLLRAAAEQHLTKKFAKVEDAGRWIEGAAGPWLYLSAATIQKHDADPGEVEQALASWLADQKGILAAYPRSQLLREAPADDPLLQSVRLSFHPDRAGNVYFLLKPYHLLYGSTGTTHGTPHDYDTHVPLIVFGPRVRRGARHDRVTPLATAAILAELLGVPAPKSAGAAVPPGLWSE